MLRRRRRQPALLNRCLGVMLLAAGWLRCDSHTLTLHGNFMNRCAGTACWCFEGREW